MIKASMTNAKEDMQKRMLREQQIDAIRMVEALELAMTESADILLAEEKQAIDAVIGRAEASERRYGWSNY